MYTHSKNKHNKFVYVDIPKNADYFARLNGNLPTMPKQAYSGDEVLPHQMNKTEVLQYMQTKGKVMAKKAAEQQAED